MISDDVTKELGVWPLCKPRSLSWWLSKMHSSYFVTGKVVSVLEIALAHLFFCVEASLCVVNCSA